MRLFALAAQRVLFLAITPKTTSSSNNDPIVHMSTSRNVKERTLPAHRWPVGCHAAWLVVSSPLRSISFRTMAGCRSRTLSSCTAAARLVTVCSKLCDGRQRQQVAVEGLFQLADLAGGFDDLEQHVALLDELLLLGDGRARGLDQRDLHFLEQVFALAG